MQEQFHRGCLLGLAVGDAMGYTVEDKTWEQICEDYGPNGLLGYDLVNGCAEVTAHTQVAAYVSNGLLLALSRGKQELLPYVLQSLRQWARKQQHYREADEGGCWVAQVPALGLRRNRDIRMPDALRAQPPGTPESPINLNSGPGGLAEAVAIGLFFHPQRLEPHRVGSLTAQTIALTHGNPEAFLSGVVAAYGIAGILHDQECPLKDHFLRAAEAMNSQFRHSFPHQAGHLLTRVRLAVSLAGDPRQLTQSAMEQLRCVSASEVLAGAIYACLVSPEDFDTAIITAVNHSGDSAAVGALTGAFSGARLGMQALPDFYLESLSAAEALTVLADDLVRGTVATGLFDGEWDRKYGQGLPPEGL